MHERQTVDFLRRRYAAAIVRDDVDTASRLRAQLDMLMNPCPDKFARPLPHGVQGPEPAEPEALERERLRADSSPERRFEPRLIVSAPATGLLEARPLLSRTLRPVSTAPGVRARG